MAATLLNKTEGELKDYIATKGNPEEAYLKNYLQYFDIMKEKEVFLKSFIRARQLKRVVMMILSQRGFSSDFRGYQ